MIIEFAGFTGVGKSFIRNKIFTEMTNNGIDVLNDNEFKKIRYLSIFNLVLFIRSFFYCLKAKPKTPALFIKNIVVWYKLQVRLKYYQKYNGIVLVDEGYIHKFRLLRRNSKEKNLKLSQVYNELFFVPSIVCLVTAPLSTLIENIKKRDKVELELNEKSYNSSLDKTLLDIDFFKEKNPEISIITIQNNENFEISTILKDINVLYKQSR